MNLKKEENVILKCPYCGAPQERTIPVDVMQVKCKYCNGLIVVPPSIGKGLNRCRDHPEKVASGRCNDCGGYFCDDCLQTYDFKTRDGSALLYLCPDCLRERYLKKANGIIYAGIFCLLVGLLLAIVIPFYAILAIAGVAMIVYGFLKRREVDEEASVAEFQTDEEETEDPNAAVQSDKVNELYSRLLTYYVTRWGAQTGKELLDTDLAVYTIHGVSYADAIERIYRREEKNIRKSRI